MDVSLLICTYNREDSIIKTLESVERLTIPEGLSWEIIVIDNNSKDGTKERIKDFRTKSWLNISYVFEEEQGLSFARNRGIKESRGNIIAFIDDDVEVTENFIENLYEVFNKYSPSMLGGKVLLKFECVPPAWYSDKLRGALGISDIGENIFIADDNYEGNVGIGANMSFSREAFQKYGKFRTDLGRKGNKLLMGEDTEMYRRIRCNGGKCMYSPDVFLYHCVDKGKMDKPYFRRWFYRMGERMSTLDRTKKEVTGKKIFGIPGWRIKKVILGFFEYFRFLISGKKAESFQREIDFFEFAGYVLQRFKLRWGK